MEIRHLLQSQLEVNSNCIVMLCFPVLLDSSSASTNQYNFACAHASQFHCLVVDYYFCTVLL